MLFIQIVLFCLLYILMVKCAVKDSGRNCLYFYPQEYLAEAQKQGIADPDAVMKQGKRFMIPFCIYPAGGPAADSRPLEPCDGFQDRIPSGRAASGGGELVRCACH